MPVFIKKKEINLREKINQLDYPMGQGGLALAKTESVQEAFESIGAGRRNLLINGGFEVWQNGTSFSGNSLPTADGWGTDTSGATIVASRGEFTVGQKSVPGNPRYYYIYDVQAGNDRSRFYTRIEDVTRFFNQTVTVSGWVRAESSVSKTLNCDIDFVYNSATASILYDYNLFTIKPKQKWTYFKFTTQCRSASDTGFTGNPGDGSLEIRFGQGGDTFTGAYQWQFANLQVEFGDVATPFETRLPGETLKLCQRYLQVYDTGRLLFIGNGSSAAIGNLYMNEGMREQPTAYVYGGNTLNGALNFYSAEPTGAQVTYTGITSGNVSVYTNTQKETVNLMTVNVSGSITPIGTGENMWIDLGTSSGTMKIVLISNP